MHSNHTMTMTSTIMIRPCTTSTTRSPTSVDKKGGGVAPKRLNPFHSYSDFTRKSCKTSRYILILPKTSFEGIKTETWVRLEEDFRECLCSVCRKEKPS